MYLILLSILVVVHCCKDMNRTWEEHWSWWLLLGVTVSLTQFPVFYYFVTLTILANSWTIIVNIKMRGMTDFVIKTDQTDNVQAGGRHPIYKH